MMQQPQRRTIGSVHFLRLFGSATERARQHVRLMRAEIPHGALPYLAKKNENLIRKGPGLVHFRPIQDAVVAVYWKVVLPALYRNTEPQTRDLMEALAEETGMDFEHLRAAIFQADAMMLLSRLSMMKYLLPQLPAGGIPGCSSAILAREWTRSGKMLACRNQDYPVVGKWEPHTAVLFQEPSELGEIPHVSITTAGVHASGLTTMNREGLLLFAHAHFGRKVSFRGKTVVELGSEIASRAKTIGEAVDIARRTRRHANWAFVVGSARENTAVVIQMSPDRTEVQEPDQGLLAHSNFFHHPELQRQEALMSGACCEDLAARICRLRENLQKEKGRVEPGHLASLLGDHRDPSSGVERVVGNTVSVITTIKSALFSPEDQRFWISARGESPMGLDSEFLEVRADQFWDEDAEAPVGRVRGYQPRDPRLIEGVRFYREAYRAWHTEGHLPDFRERTLAALRRSLEAYPVDGNVWLQAGLVSFGGKDWIESRRFLQGALKLPLTPHVAAVARLFLARLDDLEGNRESALQLYRRNLAASDLEPKVLAASRDGVRRRYREARVGDLMLDLQFPDSFAY